MAGRMAMSACFGWEPIVASRCSVQIVPDTVRGSRPCVPGVVVPGLGVEGGSQPLRDNEGQERITTQN